MENVERLAGQIAEWLDGHCAFFLLEGISYYLSEQIMDCLFRSLSGIAPADSLIAFDFWPPAMESHPIFDKLRRHFADGQTHPREMYYVALLECRESL